ncbi:divergent polysaccharide deacetylase family protein, partial [Treponema sp. OttesenSCG-928-L16]|nr:divergent polysaccharide deacetylase family protein [Treponema sp. OttesenSCG-928-L16]
AQDSPEYPPDPAAAERPEFVQERPPDLRPVFSAPPEAGRPPAAEPLKPAGQVQPSESVPSAEPEKTSAAPSRSSGITEQPPKPKPLPELTGTAAIVIDDAGNNLHELEPFLRFPGPLTIAVLPGLPHSAEAARRIRAAGKEVFLHQPMEAIGGQNPGPGAIYSGMGEGEVRSVLERNLAEIGPVAGMNNHQGSKVTMDDKLMEIVLTLCREKGILFLDSRTTAETAAPRVAERMGIKIGERDVFVDNIQEKAAMVRYIHEGLEKAEKKGAAVMIGHVWSSELAAILEELYPDMIEQGYSLSTISQLVMGKDDDEGPWY